MRSGEAVREMEMGSVVVEKVGGRSSVTSCFSRYPLKFIIPKKVFSNLQFYYYYYYIMNLIGMHLKCIFTSQPKNRVHFYMNLIKIY